MSVGFWDSLLVGIVSGGKSEIVIKFEKAYGEVCSGCLKYCRMRFLLVMCSLNDSALLQQRITAPVVKTSCILSQYFLLLDKGKGQSHFPFKDG